MIKLDQSAKKEIVHIAAGQMIGVALELVVFFLLNKMTTKVIYSALIGASVAMMGFVWLCFSVQRTVDKAAQGKDVTGVMTKSYIGRVVLYAAWIVCAVKFSVFDSIGGVLPIMFPTLTIKLMNLYKSIKNKNKGEE